MFQIFFPDHCTYFQQKGVFSVDTCDQASFFEWHVPDFIWSHDHHLTKKNTILQRAASRAQVEDLQQQLKWNKERR